MIILRFVTSDDTAISRGIQFAQGGFWCSHVEAVMPEGTLLGAHLQGGVQNRPADYDATEWTREEVVAVPATEAQTAAFHEFMRAEIGKPYDLTAIAAFVARRNWQEPDSWFCSELVMAMLEKAAVVPVQAAGSPPTLPTEVNHITPRDCRLIVAAIGGASSGITSRATEETK